MGISPDTLVFRDAQKKDIKEIVNIHNSNVINKDTNFQKQGFLLEKINYDSVLNKMDGSTENYHVAVDKTNSILGYLALSKKIDKNILQKVRWENNFDHKSIMSDRHIYIAVSAIKPGIIGKGVGQFLYKQLYLNYPNYIYSAFIAIKPYKNERSLDFHLRQGFCVVGHYKNKYFCGLNNYESKLLCKSSKNPI